jgi:hypothetical protein
MNIEDIREFLVRRPWLHGDSAHALVTNAEYQAIKERKFQMDPTRASYLRAFIDGWMRAKA